MNKKILEKICRLKEAFLKVEYELKVLRQLELLELAELKVSKLA